MADLGLATVVDARAVAVTGGGCTAWPGHHRRVRVRVRVR